MRIVILLIVSLAFANQGFSQKEYKVGCIGFYNFENLFDTLDTEDVRDTEFTPDGDKHWTGELYWEKQGHLAEVISQLGTDLTPDGVSILGVSEIENRSVLEDFVKQDKVEFVSVYSFHSLSKRILTKLSIIQSE